MSTHHIFTSILERVQLLDACASGAIVMYINGESLDV